MRNAERDNSLLGQRKYIHARINPSPNPIANYKPYPKVTQQERMKSFYGFDYRKVGDIRFSADLVYCSTVVSVSSLIKTFDYTEQHISRGYVTLF